MNFKDIIGDWKNFSLFRIFRKKRKTLYTEYKSGSTGRPLSDEEYNVMKAERQNRIDKILEKISKSGYESLTKEEKEILFKSSNNSG